MLISGNNLDVSYSYDQSGTRISKTVNGTKYEYQYEGGKLFYEKRDKAEFYYLYDGLGSLTSIIHYDGNGNRAQYYVLCNSRGDVVDIYNQSRQLQAHYTYDSWGNTISITDSVAGGREITDPTNIGILNQIRYRGYYLDTETGYYYLMSRYYNPEVGRFLNADVFCSTGDSVFAANMYVYCLNNPINSIDLNGLKTAAETVGIVITEIFICWDLQEIAKLLHIDFSYTNLSDYFDMKVKIYKQYFDIVPKTIATQFYSEFTGRMSTYLGFASGIPSSVDNIISVLPYMTNLINDSSGRYITPLGAVIMNLFDLVINGIIDIGDKVISASVSPTIGALFGATSNWLYDIDSIRVKAEYIAYNWYYLF